MKKTICKVLVTTVALQAAMGATPSLAEQTKGVAEQSINSAKQTGSWEKWWNWAGAHYDWYYKKSDGSWHTGWLEYGNKLYYLNSYGAMQKGSTSIDGATYNFDNSGALIPTGEGKWVKVGKNHSYYLNSNGAMQTGLLQLGGAKYYFDSDGTMQTGLVLVRNQHYYFRSDGAMHTGWLKTDWLKDGDQWCYIKSDGKWHSGWLQLDGKTYYFDNLGIMKTGLLQLDGKTYYFDNNGAMQTGLVLVRNQHYYFGSDGAMHTG
ncbi:hypothetical protein IIC_04344, partial [Bacillus cereus VD021]